MKYTQIPADTFSQLQLNAGVLLSDFDPKTGTLSKNNIIAATTGGVSFTATPEFVDFGEDIDNCPANMMELKRQDSIEVKLSGTAVTCNTKSAKLLMGAADVADGVFTPRKDLATSDFSTIWWVGDYGADNSEATGGFIAVEMMNALNTGGFQIQSTDNSKGNFAFEFTGHYSISAPETVPYKLYLNEGGTASGVSETE